MGPVGCSAVGPRPLGIKYSNYRIGSISECGGGSRGEHPLSIIFFTSILTSAASLGSLKGGHAELMDK